MDYETAAKIVEECCGGCRTASDETVKACAVVDAEIERLRQEESETQCHLFNMTPRRTLNDMKESAYEQAEFLRPQIEEQQAEIDRLRPALTEVTDIIDDVLFDPTFHPRDEHGDEIRGNDLYLIPHPVQEHHMPALRMWFVQQTARAAGGGE
jgi:hypothetical protein